MELPLSFGARLRFWGFPAAAPAGGGGVGDDDKDDTEESALAAEEAASRACMTSRARQSFWATRIFGCSNDETASAHRVSLPAGVSRRRKTCRTGTPVPVRVAEFHRCSHPSRPSRGTPTTRAAYAARYPAPGAGRSAFQAISRMPFESQLNSPDREMVRGRLLRDASLETRLTDAIVRIAISGASARETSSAIRSNRSFRWLSVKHGETNHRRQ